MATWDHGLLRPLRQALCGARPLRARYCSETHRVADREDRGTRLADSGAERAKTMRGGGSF